MKKRTNFINLSDPREKIKAIISLLFTGGIEIAAIYISIAAYQWWALIVALIFPAFCFVSVKYTLAVYGRGVTLSGDEFSFEPEYKKKYKLNKRELKAIYLFSPGKEKLDDPEVSCRNVYLVFSMKNGSKINYPLSFITNQMLSTLRRSLL